MAKNPNPVAVGDVVAIKSGSQRMTVVSLSWLMATVLWSDFDTKEIHTKDIPVVALTTGAGNGANA